MALDLTVVSIPGYFGTMGVEYAWLRRRAEARRTARRRARARRGIGAPGTHSTQEQYESEPLRHLFIGHLARSRFANKLSTIANAYIGDLTPIERLSDGGQNCLHDMCIVGNA